MPHGLRQSTCGGPDYTYDAENRMSASAAGGLYFYDGDGERVKKSSGTIYWGLSGNSPLAEGDLSGNINREFIFFGGKRIARLDLPAGAVHYYFSDHLGSSNVVTNSTGTTIEEESDFYPFGGERVLTDLLPDQRYKFTGKERDPDTGLDYFGARYYSSSLGRFITPDWASAPTAVPYAEFGDPQSLNLYTYVRNNPLSHADADGHCCEAEWAYFQQELAGVWDTTGGAAVDAIDQLSSGQAADNVRATYFSGDLSGKVAEAGGEAASQTVSMVKSAAEGDPRAIGQVAGIVISAKVASELKSAGGTQTEADLAGRARTIHSKLDPIAQGKRTTAVAQTADAQRLVSTSSRTTLTPAQRAALKPGETIAKGKATTHAEAKILDTAKQGSVTQMAVTRPPCPSCAARLKASKVRVKVTQ